jgi:hypothetical protein
LFRFKLVVHKYMELCLNIQMSPELIKNTLNEKKVSAE